MKGVLEVLAREEIEALLCACPLGIAFCRQQTVTVANTILLRMLGVGGDARILNRPLAHFVAHESAAAFEQLLACAHDPDSAKRTGEVKLLRMDGATFDAEVTAYGDRAGPEAHAVLYVRDLSRRKQSALLHQSAKQELEKLVAERTAVSEEQLMQLRAMAMKLTQVEHAERRRLARVMHDRVQQSLVAAKFALAVMPGRSEGHAAYEAWQNVCQMLDECIECSRSLAIELCPPVLYTSGLPEALVWLARQKKDQGLVVDLTVDPEAKPASDEVAAFFYEAVNELLFNVIKHSGVKRACVSLSQNGNAIELEVSDRGIGFDPLFTKEAGGGATGLGLLGIRERLIHLGYGFRLESAPGKGTRVWLRAPKQAKPGAGDSDLAYGVLEAERPRLAAEKESSSGKIRVLLVDDHEIVRKGIRQLLEEDPHIEVVGEAADGRAAVESALTLRPDAIIMDVVMPKINGIQATRRIVTYMPGVRIIGLSIFSDEEMARQMLQSGACAYLTKGGPVDALLAAVKNQPAGNPPQA